MIHKVKSQKDLDEILKNNKWSHMEILFDGAELRGSSRAVLRGSSHAVLRDSSRAVLRNSSHAVLWDSSHAELQDSSHAELRDFSVVHQFNNKKLKKGKYATIIKPEYPSLTIEWCFLKGIYDVVPVFPSV